MQDPRNGYPSQQTNNTKKLQNPQPKKKTTSDILIQYFWYTDNRENYTIFQQNRKRTEREDNLSSAEGNLKPSCTAYVHKIVVINHKMKEHLAVCWHNTAFWHLPLYTILHCCQWELYILNNSRMNGYLTGCENMAFTPQKIRAGNLHGCLKVSLNVD